MSVNTLMFIDVTKCILNGKGNGWEGMQIITFHVRTS